MILAAVVALSLAAPDKVPAGPRHGDHTRESRRLGGRSGTPLGVSFRFAPTDGAGMTEECACTNPTGAQGETLTFTRASPATCTKGPTSSGIDNGDLIYCSADQPRVMRGGDGTGSKGLMVEVARTNYSLRSQEMENAVWQVLGATPVVRQDHGTAPDNTATADAVHFPAVASGSRAALYQAFTGASPGACTMYLKAAPPADGGVAVAGTIEMTANSGATPCVTCSYATDTWSRCEFTGNATTYVFIGNLSGYGACASGTRNAADVYVWGVQCEAGPYASSYIPTAGAPATRSIETASFPVGPRSTSPSTSLHATWVAPGVQNTSGNAESGPVCIQQDATNNIRSRLLSQTAPNMRPSCAVVTTGQTATLTYGSNVSMAAGAHQWACSWSQPTTTKSVFFDGLSASNSTQTAATPFVWDTLKLQGDCPDSAFTAAFSRPNGVVSDVCLGPSLTRCTATQ